MENSKIKQLILEARSNYKLPQSSIFLNSSSYKSLDGLKLTFSQRMTCFLVFFVFGLLSFFYSMTKLFTAIFSPTKFIIPYVFSNLMFFTMMGFIYGFKDYFKSLFSKNRKRFTLGFLSSTAATIFFCNFVNFYILNLVFVAIQIVSFCMFAITFVPFGANTLNMMLKNMFKI